MIILESTTYPGTTRELIYDVFSDMFDIGVDTFISFASERIDPGNKKYKFQNIPKVVGGITNKCTELTFLLYSKVVPSVFCTDNPEEAEMSKLLENTFRSINIGLVNEIAQMCDRMNINVWNVIDASATKPFGFMKFEPGPGIGGHCIPLDPEYLYQKAKTFDFYSRFIELSTDINRNMPRFVVNKLIKLLSNILGLSICNSRILLIGLSYKENISDVRESPSLEIYNILNHEYNCLNIQCFDPIVDHTYLSDFIINSLNDYEKKSYYDCSVILSPHYKYDIFMKEMNGIYERSSIIFDTKNKSEKLFNKDHLLKIRKL
jgi:UDP-N-acetyl-D-glucosamine dehydrogenase